MLLLAAAAAVAMNTDHRPARLPAAVVQARASVRILSGARLRLGHRPDTPGATLQARVIRADGLSQPATLIEFE